jgi:hypothetical protein
MKKILILLALIFLTSCTHYQGSGSSGNSSSSTSNSTLNLTALFNLANYSAEYSSSGFKNENFTSNYNTITDRWQLANFTTSFQNQIPLCTAGDYLTSSDGNTVICGTPSGSSSNLPNISIFTSNGTWTKPTGAKIVEVFLIGGGGGGGSGTKGDNVSAVGGGGGGGGGGFSTYKFNSNDINSSVNVVVGLGGIGAIGQTIDQKVGFNGTSGETTKFGEYLKANGGIFGRASATIAGGGNAGVRGEGFFGATSFVGDGTAGSTSSGVAASAWNGGAGGSGFAANSNLTVGGGAAGNGTNNRFIYSGINAVAGGYVMDTDNYLNGQNGASYMVSGWYTLGTGGGGGGASNISNVNGGNGGNGGLYGGGGGGGGAHRATMNILVSSGAGGNGSQGIAVIISS